MPTDRLSTLLHELDDLAVAPAPPEVVRSRGTSIRRRRQGAAGAALLALAAAAVVGLGAVSGLQDDTSLQPAPFADQTDTRFEEGPDVVDGNDLGFVRGFEGEGEDVVLVLDRAVWYDQEELAERLAEQGRDPQEAVAFEVVDEREDLRRYPVSPDVEVTLTVGLAPPDVQSGSVPATLDELRELLSDPDVAQAHLFDVTVEDGVVVRIDHRYMS